MHHFTFYFYLCLEINVTFVIVINDLDVILWPLKRKERKNYTRVGKPDGRNIGKTLDSNDQNQVADQRFSLKECLAGGAQSRGLRKPGCCHCYLRFFRNIVVEGGNTTVATNTNRSTQDRHTWLSVLWMLVYDSYRDPAASFLLRYKIWFSTCWDDSVLCRFFVHVVLNRVVLLI